MKTFLVLLVCFVLALTSVATADAKNTRGKLADYKMMELPAAATDPMAAGGSMFEAAGQGTTLLGWWQFDTATGVPDPQGWTTHDITAQLKTYFHVDGPGCSGAAALSGTKSMWCGEWSSPADPWCGWATLPGYGNGWDQRFVTVDINPGATMTYTAIWDSEPGYDFTYVEYWDDSNFGWVRIGSVNGGAGSFTGAGGPVTETVSAGGATTTKFRFHFVSDTAWSDEDGLWPTNEGAFKVDNITVDDGAIHTENFEGEICGATASTDGFWSADVAPPYGLYADLHSAATVVQEDPCLRPLSALWVFFDDPMNTNYACGGWPLQGAMPYGPDENGLYMNNEVWSPWFPMTGAGSQFTLEFLTYRDLPLDNLQFFIFHVRSKDTGGCPTTWRDYNFVYYGGLKDWVRWVWDVGVFIPADAVDMQVAIGAVDLCNVWCGVYGTGACHSHAPTIDQVRVLRVDVQGPQWNVRRLELFQDNFPEEGGVGPADYARCDAAVDILPNSSPSILPGDSVALEVTDPNGLADDNTGGRPGKAVYLFARVTDRFGNPRPGKNGTAIQSPDNRAHAGDPNAGLLRWPHVGTVTADGVTWDQYRMDYVYSANGNPVPDRYCCDLMDLGSGPSGPHYDHPNENTAANVGIFAPGDVINYFLGAKNSLGQWSYWYLTYRGQELAARTTVIDEAARDALEWSVLPDAGRLAGEEGDILFVDAGIIWDQRYFDGVFKILGIEDRVDRYDVNSASSFVGNYLPSRVKDIANQMIGGSTEIYQKVIWSSGWLSWGSMTDGGSPNGGSGPDKTDGFGLCYAFLNQHPDNPGWYCTGNNLAECWATLSGSNAVNVKSTYMNFNLISSDHVSVGEPVSPLVTKTSGSPIGPPAMYAYGGCPLIDDFDVLQPIGGAFRAMQYTTPANGAVIAQATPNAVGTTARFALSGFGFSNIADDQTVPPQTTIDRAAHLRDILVWFENIISDPIGLEPVAFETRLENAYPNPFNPATTIAYSIAGRCRVTLEIFNVAGQRVRTLVDEEQTPREAGFEKIWNGVDDRGRPVASGVYFYRLTAGDQALTKKMVLLK